MPESELSNHTEFLAIKYKLNKKPPSDKPDNDSVTTTYVSTKRKSKCKGK